MPAIPRRYSHYLFATIQSGLTTFIAAGIASFPAAATTLFFQHWLMSWIVAWVVMMPVVILAAPGIRALSVSLTRDDS